MNRSSIKTGGAPAALGPYSQAVKAGNLLFCAGQLGLDPATMELVPGGVEAQAEQALKNLAAVLAAGGSSFGQVVKTVIFLADMGDFAVVNGVYARAFEGMEPPARSTVQVAALPKAGRVEIEMIAICD
ncbi:MAG: RidA family protein [Caldilineaceae bacterium]